MMNMFEKLPIIPGWLINRVYNDDLKSLMLHPEKHLKYLEEHNYFLWETLWRTLRSTVSDITPCSPLGKGSAESCFRRVLTALRLLDQALKYESWQRAIYNMQIADN